MAKIAHVLDNKILLIDRANLKCMVFLCCHISYKDLLSGDFGYPILLLNMRVISENISKK